MNRLHGMYASVIFVNGKATKYFMDEISTQHGKLFLSKDEYIKTYYLLTPADVMCFLDPFDGMCGAKGIEV